MAKQNKIAANLQQDYTEAEKAQARQNIGLAEVAHSGDYNDLINKPAQVTGQVQSNWEQTNETAVDFIKNKPTIVAQVNADWEATSGVAKILNKPVIRVYKTYVNSYDYPDCMHVRTPGANTRVITYFPYEDRKKVEFVDGRVYNLRITTSEIQPQDDTIETITAKLFTLDTNHQPKYLCPSYTFKAGNSAQFDLNWQASGVLSLTDAYLDECAPHIEFDCFLKESADIAIYCNGLEWFLNELST